MEFLNKMNPLDIGINVNSIPLLFFSNSSFKPLKNYPQKKKKKIIRLLDLSCKEYIRLSHSLSKIKNSFHLYEKVEFIQPTEIDQDFIKKMDYKQLNKYVLFTYPFLEENCSFMKIIKEQVSSKNPSPSLFFSTIIQSYSHFLNSLIKISLLKNNLCLLSISSSTIFFNDERQPFFVSLQDAFLFSQKITPLFMEKTMEKITKLKNFSFQPMEVHLLFFLYKNGSNFLSISDLVEVINHYFISMPFFSTFSNSEKEKWKETCIQSLKDLVSMDFSTIFEKIMKEYSFSWDNFALSMLYFYILEKINIIFPSSDFIFFKEWSKLLLQNLDPNPLKREKVDNTKKVFEKMFVDNPHWLFLKEVEKEKMILLFKILE